MKRLGSWQGIRGSARARACFVSCFRLDMTAARPCVAEAGDGGREME